MKTRSFFVGAARLRRSLTLAIVLTLIVSPWTIASLCASGKQPTISREKPSQLWVSPLLARLLNGIALVEKEEAEEEDESRELPPQLFIENLPAALNPLRPQLQPRSVPALEYQFGAATTGPFWTALGPAPIPNGQTSNRVDPVTGRATSIAIHPNNADIVYLGTAQGGLWRSLNGGGTWTQLMDNAVSTALGTPLSIGAVTLDPSNPSTLFVGTGEGNLSADSFFGTGFYIITNADSFNPIVNGPYNIRLETDPTLNGTDAFTGRSIVGIAVDSTNSNNVFVVTSSGVGGIVPVAFSVPPQRGLFRCMNALAGVNGTGTPGWTRLQITGTTATNTIATGVVIEPGAPNNVVVSFLGQAAGDPAGVYRTTNALAATPTFTLSKATPLGATNGNSKLGISKAGAAVTVYLTTSEGTASSQGRLYKSVDGGATFGAAIASANGFAGAQGFYDIALGVDPTNANNVSVGGNTANNIFRFSNNGGATALGASITGLHADVHAIAYAPSNPAVIYHANDGGIWRSNNGGANWISLNNGTLNTVQFSGLAIHPTDRNFSLGGTQDNGTEFLRPDGTWIRADFGDGGYSLIDQSSVGTTNVTMYHTYFNQTNNLIGTGRVLSVPCAVEAQWALRGAFTGADPTPVCDGSPGEVLNGIALTDAVNFYAAMVLGPGNPNTWYFGTDKLYRSIDRADTAVVSSQLLQSGIPVSAIGIAPQDDNVRLVGLNNGKVFATTTGSSALVQIAGVGATNGPTTTPATGVGRIVIDPNNKNVAYIAFNGFGTPAAPIAHLYKTTNLNALNAVPAGTITLTAMSSGLPDIPLNAIAIDPRSGTPSPRTAKGSPEGLPAADSTDIYVGGDNGVYISRNGGWTWAPYGQLFPHVAVFGLEIQNQSRILRAATHGRGMYEIFTALQPATPLLSRVVSRKTHGAAGTFDFNMPLTGTSGEETRFGGAGMNYTIVFSFTDVITAGSVAVTSGTGSVSNVSFAGSDMIVTLSGVANAQILTLTATGVTGPSGTLPSVAINIGFLMGDVTVNRAVDSGDTTVARNNSGQNVDGTNIRSDVNADGLINSGDTFIVRARAGTSIP